MGPLSPERGGERVPEPIESIESWLASLGLSRYAQKFKAHQIDLDILQDLTSADLKELGVALGDRRRMLRAIAAAKPAEPVAETRTPSGSGARSTRARGAAAERRQVTIVFCDLVGSTELAGRLDPEDLGAVLRAFQQCCVSVTERWDGHLAAFLGDGAVIYFGWPTAHEADPERAVHAALELTQAVGRVSALDGSTLTARAGIATGMVVVGEINSEGVTQRDGVAGQTPNLAARIQTIARPGEVVIAPQTYRLIGDGFSVDSLGEHALKGIESPVEVWRVNAPIARKSRFEARVGGRTLPLIGRRRELATLVSCWNASRAGTGEAVLIRGEPGIGKSRLLRAFLERTRDVPSTIIELQCSPFHVSTPLLPFIEWLEHATGVSGDTAPETAVERIGAYLVQLGFDPAKTVPLAASLLSVPLGEAYPPLDFSPQLRRERTIQLLTDIVEHLAAPRPVGIVVEDLHWADPTTVELLRRLVARIRTLPACLAMTARIEFDATFETAHRIDLQRLPPETALAMVANLTDQKALPPAVIDAILGSADGVPLFVEEVTRALLESSRLRDAGDHYELSGAGLDLSVPATLHDLLVARLDSLPAGKDVAQVASALGRSFSLKLLHSVLLTPEPRLSRDLAALVAAGILEMEEGMSDDPTYAFRHALIRDTAYHSQLKTRRREVHARAADVLERDHPDVVEREPELLAHHHAEGGRPLVAATYLLRAGRRALQECATREATTHLVRGLSLLEMLPRSPERDRTELRLQAILGTCHMLALGWAAEEVATAYTAAANSSHAAETTAEAIWILWGQWVYYQVRGRIDDALGASARIQALADRAGDADVELVADMIALQVFLYAGRFGESRARCQSFGRRFDGERHRGLTELYTTDLELVYEVHHSIALWIAGEVAPAAAAARRAEALADRLSHRYSVAWGSIWGSMVDVLLGRFDPAAARCRRGLRIAHEQHYAYVAALGEMMAGWIDGLRGDPGRGEERIGTGLAAFRSTGAEIVVPFFRTVQAELLLERGRSHEALECLDEAIARIEQYGERWQEAEVHRVRGNALAMRAGDERGPLVEASYRRAMEVAARQGARGWELRAGADFARYLGGAGRSGEGIALLTPVLAEYAGTLSTPDVTRAERIVTDLRRTSIGGM